MTDRYAVIGNPIGHSKSPLIHGTFARDTHQDLEYGLIEAPVDGFVAAVAAFRAAGGRGMNVTTPFKVEAFALADEKLPRAQLAGAANALKFEGGRIVADNFKGGAELGFALGDPDIAVLPHPLNRKHGRAPQLHLWGLEVHRRRELGQHPLLLVVGTSEVEYKNLLAHYHALCTRLGPLPPPRVVNVDHGGQRFLLFALDRRPRRGRCTTPAMAWIDRPAVNVRVDASFSVSGWAFKDGIGLAGVDVLLDGKPVSRARYGLDNAGPARYWPESTDPHHPDVGFSAQVDASSVRPGRHWLGLRLHGSDGSIEDWSEIPVTTGR